MKWQMKQPALSYIHPAAAHQNRLIPSQHKPHHVGKRLAESAICTDPSTMFRCKVHSGPQECGRGVVLDARTVAQSLLEQVLQLLHASPQLGPCSSPTKQTDAARDVRRRNSFIQTGPHAPHWLACCHTESLGPGGLHSAAQTPTCLGRPSRARSQAVMHALDRLVHCHQVAIAIAVASCVQGQDQAVPALVVGDELPDRPAHAARRNWSAAPPQETQFKNLRRPLTCTAAGS